MIIAEDLKGCAWWLVLALAPWAAFAADTRPPATSAPATVPYTKPPVYKEASKPLPGGLDPMARRPSWITDEGEDLALRWKSRYLDSAKDARTAMERENEKLPPEKRWRYLTGKLTLDKDKLEDPPKGGTAEATEPKKEEPKDSAGGFLVGMLAAKEKQGAVTYRVGLRDPTQLKKLRLFHDKELTVWGRNVSDKDKEKPAPPKAADPKTGSKPAAPPSSASGQDYFEIWNIVSEEPPPPPPAKRIKAGGM